MKPVSNIQEQSQTFFSSSPFFFPQCCPHTTQEHIQLPEDRPSRRSKIYLTLNKNIHKDLTPTKNQAEKKNNVDFKPMPLMDHTFQEDKLSFLHQIRKYNPNPETQKQFTPQTKGKNLDQTRDMNSSGKTQDNNLSSLIQNLNNEIFSDMFVSSAVKGKIVLSGSLGSISQVKSDMEISCPSEAIGHTYRNSEDR